MKEYHGRSKTLIGLGIANIVLLAIIIGVLIIVGVKALTVVISLFIAWVISFLYKGMVVKIAVDKEKVMIYKPLGKKTIRFADIAFCMIHGIDETSSIMYAFVKKRRGRKIGVRGIKQDLSFEEVVKKINKSDDNFDLDINFNMAEKIPVSFVVGSEELKSEIMDKLGGYQKQFLNKL
jgi:hypothetical protein